MSTSNRAKKGGEIGANGEFYDGGKFIARTNKPKGHPEPTKMRRIQIDRYVWVEASTGMRSIYECLAGYEIRDGAGFRFNPELKSYFATPEAIAQRKELIAKFNAGERYR